MLSAYRCKRATHGMLGPLAEFTLHSRSKGKDYHKLIQQELKIIFYKTEATLIDEVKELKPSCS